MDAPKTTSPLEMMRWIVRAQRKAGEDMFRARELTVEQAFVLDYLAEHPGAIQRDIARATRTSAASVSSLLQGLERRGLVERRTEPGDDRSKRVHPTPAGSEIVAGMDTAMAGVEERILSVLDPAERASLQALLAKVIAPIQL